MCALPLAPKSRRAFLYPKNAICYATCQVRDREYPEICRRRVHLQLVNGSRLLKIQARKHIVLARLKLQVFTNPLARIASTCPQIA